jgi:S1-C subfamily serine protease
MSIELRILGGARAGKSYTFEKSTIAIGRHPTSDLLFDTKRDLEVSTRHGEIRASDGRYTLWDLQSTNGTFVNGHRVPAGTSRELRDGDVITFGLNGPNTEVRVGPVVSPGQLAPTATPRPVVSEPVITRPSTRVNLFDESAPAAAASPAPGKKRARTSERIAIAVHQQTRKLRLLAAGTVVVLGGIALAIYFKGREETAGRDREIETLLAKNDTASRAFQAQLQGMNDPALTNTLRRRNDSLTKVVRAAARGSKEGTDAQLRLQKDNELQQKFSRVDFAAVRSANDAAIVMIVTNLGAGLEATGFSVNASGMIVTNRHVVLDSSGRATTINVKFANTGRWLHAHLVRAGEGEDMDLAVLQIEESGTYPKVRGLAASVDVRVGDPITSLGFPLGTDTPMDGSVAKTSLTPGTVSKIVPDVLQIDSYATHGSSGSPVFDAHGHVVGVVWGGPVEARGRIVYAVPADRVTSLVQGTK